MGKMYNTVEELLPALIASFQGHTMFEEMEEGDIVSAFPLLSDEIAYEMVNETNALLAAYFEVGEEEERCYQVDSFADKNDNPILFWKDYINCFFDLELVDDDSINKPFLGTAFGMYRITKVVYIDEVNKRLKRRRLNGIRLEYKVKGTPMDRNKHWNRSYDKDF